MKYKHRLEPIELTSKNGFVIAADAHTPIMTGRDYYALDSTAAESTGGLLRKKNVEIHPNSPAATMTASELAGSSIEFSYNGRAVTASFPCVSGCRMLILTAPFLDPPFSVKLPQRLVGPDLDYTLQEMARGLFGENVRCGSNERAIGKVWREFRTFLRHNKKHV